MKQKNKSGIFVLLAMLLSIFSGNAQALTTPAAPPADMFQLPWEQGLSWVAFDGFDNGSRRLPTSPHNYLQGGAIDFAPRVDMFVGMDTSTFWVTAAADGIVKTVSSCHIVIDHGNGWTTEYWHLANILVKVADTVSRNQKLAVIADNKTVRVCTGNEHPGPHLHFVMRPSMKDTKFAGWTINFNATTNKTSFTKNGQTVNQYEPILNAMPVTSTSTPTSTATATMTSTSTVTSTATASPTNTASVTPTNPVCSTTTPEPLQVDAVTSPTSQTSQVIIVRIGNGDSVTVTHEFGTTTATGDFSSINPALVTIPLQTNATHHLTVSAHVKAIPGSGGCTYGNYTLTTTVDRFGAPLTIVQTDGAITSTFTPTVTTTPSNTATPTPTGTLPITNTPTATTTGIITNTPTSTATATNTPTSTPTGTVLPSGPYVLTDAAQPNLLVGENSLVTVSLNNVPAEGYTSAEFTCTYNASLLSVSNITVAGLFGANPVVAINGPQNGSFILAMVGIGGNKATTSGTVFTFNVTALQLGQSPVECTARVSKGLSVYENIAFTGDIVNILGAITPTSSPTATAIGPLPPLVTGQVLASKPVTIRLYNLDTTLAATIPANPDGTFNFNAAAGSYTIVASAEGFLNAQGSITLTNGVTTTMPTINLIAGDVDGNSIINQLDALTIGMNYNGSTPTAADLNNDGVINVLDLQMLALHYGQSGALAW